MTKQEKLKKHMEYLGITKYKTYKHLGPETAELVFSLDNPQEVQIETFIETNRNEKLDRRTKTIKLEEVVDQFLQEIVPEVDSLILENLIREEKIERGLETWSLFNTKNKSK